MRGCIKSRGKKYVVIVTVGKKKNKDGKLIPDQKWITCDSKKQAEAKLAELINQVNKGEYIPDSKITVGEWLKRWLDVYVMKSSKKKLRTKESYKNIVENHLIPALGDYLLQKLKPIHIQNYYNTSPLSDKTKSIHQATLYQALKVAMVQEGLIKENSAELVAEKPNGKKITHEMQTWSKEEVKKFLGIAKNRGIKTECFYTLALETGMRKGEICGLKWEDVNWETSIISIQRTLLKAGVNPILGTPKSNKTRAVAISRDTMELLRRLKVEQNKLKLSQGSAFNDQGYIFTKKNGGPLQLNNIGENEFNKIIKKAKVKQIRFHDLRHTAITLMLEQGIHYKVVAERVGHSDVSITLNRYSHVSADLQKEAAQKIGSLLSSH